MFTKRASNEWWSHMSLLKDNQFTWVMDHSIVRKRSGIDYFSLRPYLYVYFLCPYSRWRNTFVDTLCLFIHCIYVCISHTNVSFFFNQPTKYRRPSGARRSTTVRTIVIIIVLQHSSYPLKHPLFFLVLFVYRWPNNTRYICISEVYSFKATADRSGPSLFLLFYSSLSCIHTSKFVSWTFQFVTIYTSLNRQYNRKVVDRKS